MAPCDTQLALRAAKRWKFHCRPMYDVQVLIVLNQITNFMSSVVVGRIREVGCRTDKKLFWFGGWPSKAGEAHGPSCSRHPQFHAFAQ